MKTRGEVVNLPPLTSDPPLLSYSCSHPLFQELTSQVQALLAKGAIEQMGLLTGVLQPPVPSAKTERGLAPCYRPECTQPLPVFPALPHGDGTLSYAVPPAGGLVHLYQPEGCFPARPHHTQAPQVPMLQDRGRCLSVPCTPFRLDPLRREDNNRHVAQK